MTHFFEKKEWEASKAGAARLLKGEGGPSDCSRKRKTSSGHGKGIELFRRTSPGSFIVKREEGISSFSKGKNLPHHSS